MNRIREERKKLGISMAALAERLNIAESTLGYWERDVYEPSREMLLRLSDIFGVSVDYLIGNDEMLSSEGNWIPVYGRVAAGIPINAITDIVDYEDIPRAMAKSGEYFSIRVCGHSMEPKISDGDNIIVRSQPDADDGDVAVVLVNGDDAVVKKIKKAPEGLYLISSNPAYPVLFFTPAEVETKPVRIVGKVVELRAKMG